MFGSTSSWIWTPRAQTSFPLKRVGKLALSPSTLCSLVEKAGADCSCHLEELTSLAIVMMPRLADVV